MKASRKTDFDQLKNPGDFMYYTRNGVEGHAGILFCCPCGCGVVSGVDIGPVQSPKVWKWDGNEESPTLKPSIRKLNNCKWHGFLTAGEFVTC